MDAAKHQHVSILQTTGSCTECTVTHTCININHAGTTWNCPYLAHHILTLWHRHRQFSGRQGQTGLTYIYNRKHNNCSSFKISAHWARDKDSQSVSNIALYCHSKLQYIIGYMSLLKLWTQSEFKVHAMLATLFVAMHATLFMAMRAILCSFLVLWGTMQTRVRVPPAHHYQKQTSFEMHVARYWAYLIGVRQVWFCRANIALADMDMQAPSYDRSLLYNQIIGHSYRPTHR